MIVGGVIVPGEPVLVPEVGRGRERAAVRTIGAYREAARFVSALAPETLVFVLSGAERSPAVIRPRAGELRRSFDGFDAPELTRVDRVDRALLDAVVAEGGAAWQAVNVEASPERALAPLHFLAGDGRMSVLIVAVPGKSLQDAAEVGAALAAGAVRAGRRTVVVAVGELSSRLFPGAPGGYHPEADAFDRRIVSYMQESDWDGLLGVDGQARADAGESVLAPLVAVAGAAGAATPASRPVKLDLVSYEAPFGTGYLVAVVRPRSDDHASGSRCDSPKDH